jgi:hypothetical protein
VDTHAGCHTEPSCTGQSQLAFATSNVVHFGTVAELSYVRYSRQRRRLAQHVCDLRMEIAGVCAKLRPTTQ